MNRNDVPKAHNPAWKDMAGYEWIEYGVGSGITRVVTYPYCPHGCLKYAGQKRESRFRVRRIWNYDYEHWELECPKCKRVCSAWL